MTTLRIIGRSTPRVGSADKVTGRARYTADEAPPGTLWGKVLLSPHAHARIASIDTSAAKRLPGVHAVITAHDIEANLYGRAGIKDIPVLAKDRVLYAGERVAAVAADDRDTAQRAIDLIEIEYEPLPPLLDVFDAMSPAAPLLHPDFNTYKGLRPDPPRTISGMPGITFLDKPSNAYQHITLEQGDVEQGFAEADLIVENTFQTERVHQGYLEPHVCLISVSPDRKVDLRVSTKVPYGTREHLASAVGIPEDDVVLHYSHIGGDFGAKGIPSDLPAGYFLAKLSGRPVLMAGDYVEEFYAGNPRHAVTVRLKTGVRRDGTLTAHEVGFFVNCGAYAGYKPAGLIFGPTQAAGLYRVPNCRIETAHVYTNTLPGGFMRSPGEPQAYFAIESHIDEVARAIGMDPLAFRLQNIILEGDSLPFEPAFHDTRAREALIAAAETAGYHDPRPPHVGRGVAIGHRSPGGGEGHSTVTIHTDGRVVVGTPIYDQGTGTHTLICQIVAEELQLPLDQVELDIWDTGVVGFDSGIAADRATRINSAVAWEAAQDARSALLDLAAQQRGWPAGDLELRSQEVWYRAAEESLNWRDLLAATGTTITGRGHFQDAARAEVTGFCAQVAEVSVDPETGEITLLRLTSAHDVGRILNPLGHQGQINGGVVQGIGFALTEELQLQEGRVTNVSFGDYKLPSIRDIPELRTVLLEPGEGIGPYQIKGIGETPISPVAAAIANAIADAAGVRVRHLPLTAEKVHRLLRHRP